MSKWEKLINELYSKNPNIRFEEARKILVKLGYIMYETKGGSSHVTFRRSGCLPITLPRHGHIKKAYVEIIRRAYEEATHAE